MIDSKWPPASLTRHEVILEVLCLNRNTLHVQITVQFICSFKFNECIISSAHCRTVSYHLDKAIILLILDDLNGSYRGIVPG